MKNYNMTEKGEEIFNQTIKEIKKADGIRFSSIITNEEALILEKIAKKFDIKLINDEARNYQNFLNNFSKTSGVSLYSGDDEDVKNSDFIISFGGDVTDDTPHVRGLIDEASSQNQAEIISLHPIEDNSLTKILTKYVKYEVGSEEGVIALLAKELLKNCDTDSQIKEYFEAQDDGYISAESNVGEEEIEDIVLRVKSKKNPVLIVGSDVYNHPQAGEIAKLVGLIEKFTDFKILLSPTSINSLGVALICDLKMANDDDKIVGYNAKGDFTIGACEGCNLKISALNSQKGTFTTSSKKVKVKDVSLDCEKYGLNEIANSLGLKSESITDYTSKLPLQKGYKKFAFGDLGTLGYQLDISEIQSEYRLEEVEEIDSFDGVVIYLSNPAIDEKTSQTPILVGTKQFAIAAKIKDKSRVSICFDDECEEIDFEIDEDAKGVMAKFPTSHLEFSGDAFASKYRFTRAVIKSV